NSYFDRHLARCRSKYEFNLLNLRAYMDNWSVLDPEMQRTVSALAESDLKGNGLKHGMKRREEFHRHLLLLAGCEIWNIRQFSGSNMVLSNLKGHDGLYSSVWTKNRAIDARDCKQAAFEFERDYDIGVLFKDFNAMVINFESCTDYHYSPEPDCVSRALFHDFFSENARILQRWQSSKLIYSYLYSHEVSCDTILGMRFRPHTHAIVFFKKNTVQPDLAGRLNCDDRQIQTRPETHTKYSTIKGFVRYLYGAYSLVSTYQREYTEGGVFELNKMVVQAMHGLLDLSSGDSLSPAPHRNRHSHIPRKERPAGRWHHPLLVREREAKRKATKVRKRKQPQRPVLLTVANQPLTKTFQEILQAYFT
ncbi:MAG: hypothetical protein WCL08_08390, partial [Verrucomicrobiota bacterium]